ncbi:hypothetical protein [Kitasatospora aburaviensis]|uniref:Uncharacterized protein n=1 Tax=Kitasatospora aburaviensis TaxID=67265 RepID=A0ABW1F129_9ACTN
MTATDDAPDLHTTAEERWQHIEDRLTAIDYRIRETGSAATAAIDACLARLEALRHDLAHGPWPPEDLPVPVPPQPQRAPAVGP